MKLMFASDIHGSAVYCRSMLDAFEQERAQRLCLIGDILYHGPRNDLPEGYAPKEVIALLNPLRERILCVRGNCDTEVDQMVLQFPILPDCGILADGRLFFLSHGHHFNPQNLPPLCEGDVLINGHTHVYRTECVNGVHCLNVGSVSLPKEGKERSYMTYENGVFEIKELAGGKVLCSYKI